MAKHCQLLCRLTGADSFKIMPAKRVFALGVGHVRRRTMEIGSKSELLADPRETEYVHLSTLEWKVLVALKRELTADELELAAARPPSNSGPTAPPKLPSHSTNSSALAPNSTLGASSDVSPPSSST